jgi:lysophospholipase L1-like esterase
MSSQLTTAMGFWMRRRASEPPAARPCLQTVGWCLAFAAMLTLSTPDAHAQGKRVLVFGDSNTWGWRPIKDGFPSARLDDAQRWPGVLQQQLGVGHSVVVDGLNGRTANASYAESVATLQGADFNGEQGLRIALAREAPLDLVVIMLGTNDTQDPLNRSAMQIAEGISKLVAIARKDHAGVFTTAKRPAVLVIAPPPLGDISATPFKEVFAGGAAAKSVQLAAAIRALAAAEGYSAVNAAVMVGHSGGVDGVHLTLPQHRLLGTALVPIVRGALTAETKAQK